MIADVVVIGAGIAGTAAALAASQGGAQVTAVDGGTGASLLATGALDYVPWEDEGHADPLSAGGSSRGSPALGRTRMTDVLGALGGYVLGPAQILTTAGLVRPAHGRDAALLDASGRTGRMGVIGCLRPGWDAEHLARSWGPGCALLDATVLRYADERILPDADFAARHDDEGRLGWLAERLREAVSREGGSWTALVLPPSLGVDCARAAALSKQVGVACGEAQGSPGGPAGLRFERARDRALESRRIARLRARVTGVDADGGLWRLETEEGIGLCGRALVLATGGLVGGGLEYSPSEAMHASALPARSRLPVRLNVRAPFVLGARGQPLELPGSLFGASPEEMTWPFADPWLYDRAGALVDRAGEAQHAPAGLYAAGEVAADTPRAWLACLAGGARAGEAAALHALTGRKQSAAPSPGAASSSRS